MLFTELTHLFTALTEADVLTLSIDTARAFFKQIYLSDKAFCACSHDTNPSGHVVSALTDDR